MPSGAPPSAGGVPRHAATCRVQRGAKAQPSAHGSVSDGEPGIGRSGTPRGWSSRGTDASSPVVYGCRGRGEQRPARGRLDDPAGVHDVHLVAQPGDDAEVVGDEDQRGPVPTTSSRSSSRICAWIVTSSAVVGSSAMSSRGSQASAMAIMHALAHAAGQLVRVALQPPVRVGDADAVEQLGGAVPGGLARAGRGAARGSR